MNYRYIETIGKFEIYKDDRTKKVYLRPSAHERKLPYMGVAFSSIKQAREFVINHCK